MALQIPILTGEFLLPDQEVQDNYKASFQSLKLHVKKKKLANFQNVPPKYHFFSH